MAVYSGGVDSPSLTSPLQTRLSCYALSDRLPCLESFIVIKFKQLVLHKESEAELVSLIFTLDFRFLSMTHQLMQPLCHHQNNATLWFRLPTSVMESWKESDVETVTQE